jgi:spore coat protein U-like protein
MKKILAIITAVAISAMAGAAMAADTNTLTVQASVTGTCKFSSATSTLDFGALDPSASTNPTKTITTQFWCTKGVSTDAITAGEGLNYSGTKNQMKDAVSGDVIPYVLDLSKDGVANAGPATPRTLTIKGDILNADYISKTAGSYSDTVVLNITP